MTTPRMEDGGVEAGVKVVFGFSNSIEMSTV
jgi:hypothetical protein